MKISQNQLVDVLKNKKGCSLDYLLSHFSISITNQNRLCLSSVIQKFQNIQLTYEISSGYVIRIYSLKK